MSRDPDQLDNDGPLPGPDRELSEALGALRPARPTVDRDRLMFEAGRGVGLAAARRGTSAWRGLAAVLAVALAGSLLWRTSAPNPGVQVARNPDGSSSASVSTTQTTADHTLPATLPREAPRPRPAASWALATLPTSASASPSPTYLALRRDVLLRGLDALPSPPRAAPDAGRPLPAASGLLGPGTIAGG